MNYSTTKIKPIKSYPTYQFHGYTSCRSIPVHECFKICILETFKWLRLRLGDFSDVNELLQTPEPNDYAGFPDECLRSFTINSGFSIDVVYVEKAGIWSFNISEADMGANIGTPTERKAVQGRIFSTDISFRKLDDCVEIGIRTLCSEPAGTEADCEVFRPTLVKMLASNPLAGLKNHFPIDGKTINISTKSDVDNLARTAGDSTYSFPIILVAEAPDIMKELPVPENTVLNTSGFSSFGTSSQTFSADMSKVNIDVKIPKNAVPVKEKEHRKKMINPTAAKAVTERTEIIEYDSLAKSLIGFAAVCFVHETAFKTLKNKLGITIEKGDVQIIIQGNVSSVHSYPSYKKNIKHFSSELKADMKLFPKRRQVSFGGVLFNSDARLLEIEEKRSDNLTSAERNELLANENNELKKKIQELVQREVDTAQTSDSLRIMQKKLIQLQDEKDNAVYRYEQIAAAHEAILSSYRTESAKTAFYRQKCRIAAGFPTDKVDVCGWIKENFSDSIIVSPRAESELGKYSGALDVASLCDGIYYLHGYNLYRNGEISEDELAMYGEDGGWEASGCGKEALRVCESDYTASYNGKKYLLDLHIKHGIKAHLIRIYFCRIESERKILIGYMPAHLSTVKRKT